jgi:Flp pilus assembly protein TadB
VRPYADNDERFNMTNPTPNATGRRYSRPIWLILAILMFVIMILVAGGVVTFITNWAVWLGAAGIAICLHLWFRTEL